MREKSYSLNTELERLNMTVENLKQEELRFEEHKSNLEHRVNQLDNDLSLEKKQFNETNNKITEIDNEIKDLSSRDFENSNKTNIGQSDRSLLNNITFDKKYENAVAAIFGKELLASLENDDVFYWSENIEEAPTSTFSFECEIASKAIKAPQRLINKLNNVGILSKKEDGYSNYQKLNPGQAIVDLEGNLWRWDGLFISSSHEANISSILAELKEKRLNDLKKQLIEWQRISELTNQKIADLSKNWSMNLNVSNYKRCGPMLDICPTLLAGNGGDCIFYLSSIKRRYTPREYLNLQGFGEFNQVVSNSKLYKQVGNAMSVNILAFLYKNILKTTDL